MTTQPQQTPANAADISAMMKQLPFAQQEEFELGGTKFYLSKMPASRGLEVFHDLRSSFADLDLSDDGTTMGTALQQIAVKLPPAVFDRTQESMFQFVRYSNENTSHQVLAGSEDDACKDALDIVEVWVRMVAFNFLKSFLEKLSALNQAGSRMT